MSTNKDKQLEQMAESFMKGFTSNLMKIDFELDYDQAIEVINFVKQLKGIGKHEHE